MRIHVLLLYSNRDIPYAASSNKTKRTSAAYRPCNNKFYDDNVPENTDKPKTALVTSPNGDVM